MARWCDVKGLPFASTIIVDHPMCIIMKAQSADMAMLGSNQSDDLSKNIERGASLCLSLKLYKMLF